MSRAIALSVAGLALSVMAVPASAAHIYCIVTGSTQGVFKGDSTDNKTSGQIPVMAFMQEIKVPTDGSSGGGSGAGKLQLQPFTITKSIDSSSVQFFTAALTNENFPSIVCTLFHEAVSGEERAYFRITLKGASITDLKDSGDGVNGDVTGDDRERISFIYKGIDLQNLESNTSVSGAGQ